MFWIYILFATVLESVGDVAFRYATLNNKEIYRWLGLAAYVIGSALWAISLKHHELTKGLIVFIALNVMFVAIADRLFFGEVLKPIQIIGILLTLSGVLLVEGI